MTSRTHIYNPRRQRTLDKSIRTKRTCLGIELTCSPLYHGESLRELGFQMSLAGYYCYPAAKLVDGRIPGEAREYVKRFYAGRGK